MIMRMEMGTCIKPTNLKILDSLVVTRIKMGTCIKHTNFKILDNPVVTRMKISTDMGTLFGLFCYLPGFIVSCCAFDASKTQTAIVYAISGPFFEASGQPYSSKLAPGILYPSSV